MENKVENGGDSGEKNSWNEYNEDEPTEAATTPAPASFFTARVVSVEASIFRRRNTANLVLWDVDDVSSQRRGGIHGSARRRRLREWGRVSWVNSVCHWVSHSVTSHELIVTIENLIQRTNKLSEFVEVLSGEVVK